MDDALAMYLGECVGELQPHCDDSGRFDRRVLGEKIRERLTIRMLADDKVAAVFSLADLQEAEQCGVSESGYGGGLGFERSAQFTVCYRLGRDEFHDRETLKLDRFGDIALPEASVRATLDEAISTRH